MNSNCSNSLDLRNLQEQIKKAICCQKLFWTFTLRINCSSDLKNFANSRPSSLNFKSFSQSLELFLTLGQNNFGNKILFPYIFLFRGFIMKTTATAGRLASARTLYRRYSNTGWICIIWSLEVLLEARINKYKTTFLCNFWKTNGE